MSYLITSMNFRGAEMQTHHCSLCQIATVSHTEPVPDSSRQQPSLKAHSDVNMKWNVYNFQKAENTQDAMNVTVITCFHFIHKVAYS